MFQGLRGALVGAVLALCAAPTTAAEIFVKVDTITDFRTTDTRDAELTITLQPYGPGLRMMTGLVDFEVEEAVSDQGVNLLRDEQEQDTFHEVLGRGRLVDLRRIELRLHNPARAARSVRVKGTLRFYSPEGVDGAVAIVPLVLSQSADTPLEHPALAALGVELLLFDEAQARAYRDRQYDEQDDSPEIRMARAGGLVIVALRDEDRDPILRIGLQNGAGEEIPVRSWGSNEVSLTPSFDRALPTDVALNIQLATPEAIVEVPFDTGEIFLP